MKNYIPKSTKSKPIQQIINEALAILESVGIPMDKTERALERMAVCFLAVAGVTKKWSEAKENTNLMENIMSCKKKLLNSFYLVLVVIVLFFTLATHQISHYILKLKS